LESASTAESMLNTLRRSPDWEKAAKLIGSKTFEDIPENMSEDYAMSFLAQAGCYKGTSETFPAALCKVLDRLKSNKISLCLLEQYHDFFINFKPDQDAITQADLKSLYSFARKIKASMKWMEYLIAPIAVIMSSIWLLPSDSHITVAQLLSD